MEAVASVRGKSARPWFASAMAALLGGYVLAYILASVFAQGAARTPTLDLLNVVGPCLATFLCVFAATRAATHRLAIFWGLVATAMALCALAEATWAFYELVGEIDTPYPSIADLYWVLSYALEFAAIVSLISFGQKSRLAAIGVALEAAIFGLATLMLVWQFVILPSLDLAAPALTNLVTSLYPAGDVLLLAALGSLALLPKREQMPKGMFWVAGSLIAYVVADIAYAVATTAGTYHTGSWIDPLWPLAYVFVAAAATWQFTRFGRQAADRPESERGVASAERAANGGASLGSNVNANGGASSGVATSAERGVAASVNANGGTSFLTPDLREQTRVVMPYLAMPVASLVLLFTLTNREEPAYLHRIGPIAAVLLLAALVLGRQFVTVIENRRLQASLTVASQDLQERVVQRTNELSLLNRVAMTMSQCGRSGQVIDKGLQLAQEALGCDATGLCLHLPGPRRRFFCDPSLAKVGRLQLRAAICQACEGADPQNKDRPTMLSVEGDGAARLGIAVPFAQVVVVPLVSRRASLGSLCLAWGVKTLEDGRSQLDLASAVAAQIAVAFENARRFEDAHYLAERDPITGLLNHRGINARLEEEYARCHRISGSFSVVMMDLENFKLFNDTYGHATGDEVLQRVARVLSKAARRSDVVARYGGDEFMALLPDTNAGEAVVLVKRLQADLETQAFFPDKANGNRVPIALSYGIATYPNEGARLAEVLSAADANLYRSKQEGGNKITAPSAGWERTEKLGVYNVLKGLVTTVDNKDHYTGRHSDDVCDRAVALAGKMGLSPKTQRVLRIAGLLHDVGKIGVPDSVLRKPGPLTEEEFEAVKRHVTLGRLIIKEIPNLSEVLAAVATHHERHDGTGYPEGLKGDDIPVLGRILAVADAYSAMTMDRPYRKALSADDAVAELRRVAGTQLDPHLVQQFIELLDGERDDSLSALTGAAV